MPFDHNHAYHRLLLRHVPRGARTALDVGCGSGLFTRRLAAAGLKVEGIDPSAGMIAAARALGAGITYRQEDITAAELGRYDFISCLAALHHVPFETVLSLRAALNPGGVLAVLGLAHPRSFTDWAKWGLLAPPVNLGARLVVAAGEHLNGGPDAVAKPPVRAWDMTMTRLRHRSAELLPGSTVRTLLFWRYLLVYRA
ncbi:class I SAM-dependent methyltransferase [Amycolatopsis endophytica]|uniref:SAM-dependent methyltransferase n=1 Tax=Amycolatopsis endophytica TaxID=860233 RepID=A0A853AVT0_9PSEU|nr:class I SAM-dependent methyltransferase [Amycolatopsis endophytica]NYI86734.1 SAM-dependent methyltransferase [Amycolatopsis endophytica]